VEATALALRPSDRLACRSWIKTHSKSFFLSSLLLPDRVRHASWALYAFCRRADDAVDEPVGAGDPRGDAMRRVDWLRRRLDAVYAGRSIDDPIDRSFAEVVERHGIHRALPEALLAGMEMDARGVSYASDDDLLVYCFRVASTVGLMMTKIMTARADVAYLRAADLGVAMQLTNIARDVGEDARRGRVYLPDALLAEVGLDAEAVRRMAAPSANARESVRRILERADAHYRAAGQGIPLLPRSCRLAIASSRYIYAAIGTAIARNGYDSITRRAYVPLAHKLALVIRAAAAAIGAASCDTPGPADARLRELLAGCGIEA
jgi:phytoene synthase